MAIRKNLDEPDFFWKNFRLGTELQISGTHIYNALFFLDKLEYIQHEEDIFEFLYNISVGIERIQKIAIVLLEHDDQTDQISFEKGLITHDHLLLLARIQKSKQINLGKSHKKFLQLIRDFYTSYRYGRFNKKSIYHPDHDKHKFLDFLIAELKLEVNEVWGKYVQNDLRVKKFIGKLVSTIVCEVYEIVRERAYQIGTYTYEIRYQSKAFKIFTSKEYTFEIENNFKKEILVSLMSENGFSDEFKKYIQSIKALPLDEFNSSSYIQYLLNSIAHSSLIDEYKYLIEEKQISKNRAEEIEPIGTQQHLDNIWDEEL